jgi:phosphatidate cytidylyltransferase
MSNLAVRVLFSVIAIPFFMFLLYWNGYSRLGLLAFLSVGGAWEYGRMTGAKLGDTGWGMISPILVLGLLALDFLQASSWLPLYLAGALCLIIARAFVRSQIENIIVVIGLQVFGVLYLGIWFGLGTKPLLGSIFSTGFSDVLPFLLTAVLMWAGDTGAYFTGKSLGKHKLAPIISPKKTWEGAIGGFVLTTIIAVLFGPQVYGLSVPAVIFLGLLLSITGPMGDLLMSSVKRYAAFKDSSQIFPGHGGILDRFDSLMLSAPIAALYINAIQSYQ